jgi:hypothetical protein
MKNAYHRGASGGHRLRTGIVHDYYIGGDGGHDWGTWRAHLHHMLPKLWRTSAPSSRTSQAIRENEQ